MHLTYPQRVLTNMSEGFKSTSHTLFSGLALGLTGKYHDGDRQYMKSDYGFSDVLHGLMYAGAGLILNQTAARGLEHIREKISPTQKSFWDKHLLKIFYALGGTAAATHLHRHYKKSLLDNQTNNITDKPKEASNSTKALRRI